MPKEGQVCHSFLWGIVAKDEKFLNQASRTYLQKNEENPLEFEDSQMGVMSLLKWQFNLILTVINQRLINIRKSLLSTFLS